MPKEEKYTVYIEFEYRERKYFASEFYLFPDGSFSINGVQGESKFSPDSEHVKNIRLIVYMNDLRLAALPLSKYKGF